MPSPSSLLKLPSSSACYAGYVQYEPFNRDDVVDNSRQQSIVLFFFSFLLLMSYAPKAFIKKNILLARSMQYTQEGGGVSRVNIRADKGWAVKRARPSKKV